MKEIRPKFAHHVFGVYGWVGIYRWESLGVSEKGGTRAAKDAFAQTPLSNVGQCPNLVSGS